MATPIPFSEANCVLVGPADDASIQPLPVHRCACGGGAVISCWQLSADDLRRIAETGKVWLSVWSGDTAPPVFITGLKEDVIDG